MISLRPGLILALVWAASLTALGASDEPAAPEDAIVLDFESALRMAASSNLTVRQFALLPQMGHERVRQEGGAFDPTIDLSSTHSSDTNAQPLDPFGSRPASSKVLTDQYSSYVRGLLPTGATYRAGLSSQNVRGTFNEYQDTYYTFLGVSITQPLLRNAGTAVNLAALRLARLERKNLAWQYRQAVNDTITGTAFAYFNLVRAHEALSVSTRSVALGEQLVRDNERRFQRGAMSSQDVVEARARASRRKDALFSARLAVVDAESTLKRLIYPDFSAVAERRLKLQPFEMSEPDESSLGATAEMALEVRPDYQEALLAVEQKQIDLGVKRSGVRPSVDLVASYGYNGTDASFRDSVSRVRDGEDDSYSIGAVVSFPIFNRSARAGRNLAELELQKAELELQDFEQAVRRQLQDSIETIAIARERVDSGREARSLAEQSLAAEEKRLRAGTSTTFLVLEQQESVAQAELLEADAVAGYSIAIAQFYRLSGTTIDALGLDPDLAPVPNIR